MLASYRDYLERAVAALMAGRPDRGHPRRRARAAIGHALSFATWRSLGREQSLDDSEAAELMWGLVAVARNQR
jgi:hypothetical protein